jgi:hypothetical protein
MPTRYSDSSAFRFIGKLFSEGLNGIGFGKLTISLVPRVYYIKVNDDNKYGNNLGKHQRPLAKNNACSTTETISL